MDDPFATIRLEPAPADIPTGREREPPRPGPGEKFLKGPTPWKWLELAGGLPGKALMVGLAVWREAGCRGERTVPLNLSNLSVPRRTAHRALRALATAGLVSVEHRDGRPPLVTLNEVPGDGGWVRSGVVPPPRPTPDPPTPEGGKGGGRG